MDQQQFNFERIAKALAFVQDQFNRQPSLENMAHHVHMSPHHFQRIFLEWAGVSPKKFLQYTTLQHAKSLLREQQRSIAEVTYESGLSSSSRLHDLFISIEGMTPKTFKEGASDLCIQYAFYPSPFGQVIIANTAIGICYLSFEEDTDKAFCSLKKVFPLASFEQQEHPFQQEAVRFFNLNWDNLSQIKLHLKGSPFQLKVWEALLQIPFAALRSYGEIATKIGHPGASRAVGTAIGQNPIAFLIPCHRVIQSSGLLGGYMWGLPRKQIIIGWENAKSNLDETTI